MSKENTMVIYKKTALLMSLAVYTNINAVQSSDSEPVEFPKTVKTTTRYINAHNLDVKQINYTLEPQPKLETGFKILEVDGAFAISDEPADKARLIEAYNEGNMRVFSNTVGHVDLNDPIGDGLALSIKDVIQSHPEQERTTIQKFMQGLVIAIDDKRKTLEQPKEASVAGNPSDEDRDGASQE